MRSSHPPGIHLSHFFPMILNGRNANITVSGSPNVHTTDTHLFPSVGCDHTKSRFFLAISAPCLNPSLVTLRKRHRICYLQASVLRGLYSPLQFLYVNWLSFHLDLLHVSRVRIESPAILQSGCQCTELNPISPLSIGRSIDLRSHLSRCGMDL